MSAKQKNILILALAAVVLIAGLAVMLWRSDRYSVPPLPDPPLSYPHRDLLEDTVATAAPPPDSVVAPLPPEGSALQWGRLAGTLKLSSPTLKENDRIPRDHTCNGKNQSPPLSWSGAPRGTQSFVVLFEQPDAAKGDQLQWSLYNIPASVSTLPAAVPTGPEPGNGLGQGINDAVGNTGFVGPCIPRGQIPYQLRIFALDTPLNLPGGAQKEALFEAMNGHILDMAVMRLVHFYRL